MIKTLMAGVTLALTVLPGAAQAQDGAVLDCIPAATSSAMKASLGAAMLGAGDQASRDALFEQLAAITDDCAMRHGVAEDHRVHYFDYGLARISREHLAQAIASAGLAPQLVDGALDFGPGRTNPDLTGEMSDDQIMLIIQAYIDNGVNIEAVDSTAWETVGAYAAATSIYWNKRQTLPY